MPLLGLLGYPAGYALSAFPSVRWCRIPVRAQEEYCTVRISALRQQNIRAAQVRAGGWLPGTDGRRNMAGSVLMGLPWPPAPEFAGTVGSGLSVAGLRELTAILEAVEQPGSPY